MFVHPHQQTRQISAPLTHDKELREFSGSIQENLSRLWEISHDHVVSDTDKSIYAALSTDADRVAFIASFLGLV